MLKHLSQLRYIHITHPVPYICRIELRNEQKLNALSEDLLDELHEAVKYVYANASLRAVMLVGSGDKAFAAGAAIDQFPSLDPLAAEAFARRGQQLFRSIEHAPIPFLAAIQGYALGGGCELAMACHLRIATKNAKLGQPEVKLGLIPGYGGTARLVKLMGKTKAMEWILTGSIYSAQEAYEFGLINQLVEAEVLESVAQKLLETIAKNSPEAIAYAIQVLNSSVFDRASVCDEVEAQAFGLCAATKNFQEGTRAFLDKRTPNFSDRKP